jgi:hypothetical protein
VALLPNGDLTLIHSTSGKRSSRKAAYSIVHRTPPQNRKARSLAHPHSMTDSYMLWGWIYIRDRECFTATADWDRTTHETSVALHSPGKRRRYPRALSIPSAACLPMLGIQCE